MKRGSVRKLIGELFIDEHLSELCEEVNKFYDGKLSIEKTSILYTAMAYFEELVSEREALLFTVKLIERRAVARVAEQ